MSSHAFAEHRNTPLWSALEAIITELTASGEISVNTAPEYVIGYLCRELNAKKLLEASPLDMTGRLGNP